MRIGSSPLSCSVTRVATTDKQPRAIRDISHKRAFPAGDPDSAARKAGKQMFLAVAIILAIIWLVLFLALHVTSFFIHILIILAVISLIVHLFTGRKA
jgi:Flp pilus assembly protein TadB